MSKTVIRNLEKRFPLFWLLQIGGWGAYGLALLPATLPYLEFRYVLIYRGVLTASCFASSFVLHRVCQRLWRGRAPWPRVLLVALICSYGLGYLCAAAAAAAEHRFGAEPRVKFSWLGSLSGGLDAGFVLLAWSALYFGIKYYQALEDERRRALAAEASARAAELRALRYQIHPHFLFNTLNAISTLVVEKNAQAATQMIARLADFLRVTLEEKNPNETPLADEVVLVEQYLAIEQIRLGNRLRVELSVAPALRLALVPHLLLQPLVENAVRHGIAPQPAGGMVRVRAEAIGERLRITVVDDGQGKRIQEVMAAENVNGIGLSNTENRLRQLYGADCRFELRWPDSGGCEALIELPLRRQR